MLIPRERFRAINFSGTIALDKIKSSEKSSEKSRDKIICEMRANPEITINELATMLSISDRAVSKHLKNYKMKD